MRKYLFLYSSCLSPIRFRLLVLKEASFQQQQESFQSEIFMTLTFQMKTRSLTWSSEQEVGAESKSMVYQCYSQFAPPTSSPAVSTTPSSLHLCLYFSPVNRFFQYHFSRFCIYELIHLFFSFWVPSLCKIGSRLRVFNGSLRGSNSLGLWRRWRWKVILPHWSAVTDREYRTLNCRKIMKYV